MIKNIIFDWSGVVKDCILDHLYVVNKMFEEFGVKEISLEELRENWKQPYMLFYNKYLPYLTIEQEQIAYKKAISSAPKGKPYPGIVDLIKRFKKDGKKIVVASSDFPETVLPEIDNFGLKDLFDDIIMSVHDKTEAVEELIKRNNFKPAETIFIGDSTHEIEAGKSAGILTGAVTWGFNTEDVLRRENPDFVIHNLKELEKIILAK